MKSSHFVHGFWGAACVASFAIGSQFFTDDDTSSRAPDPKVGSGSSGQSVRVSSRQDVGSGTSEGGAGARSEIRTATGGTTKLSDAGLLALAEEFKKGKGPIERRLAFSKLLENLTAENAKTVREQLLHLSERSDEWREFHYAWGALAGDVAVLNGKETKERDMASTFAGWASSDPAAALACEAPSAADAPPGAAVAAGSTSHYRPPTSSCRQSARCATPWPPSRRSAA